MTKPLAFRAACAYLWLNKDVFMLYVPQESRQPAINVPTVLLGMVAIMAIIHGARVYLNDEQDLWVLATFAFIPGRYGILPPEFTFLSGLGPKLWTPLTYAFLHGDWTHFGFNAIWLVIFGTPVARRFGALRFLAFTMVLAAAGALVHGLVERHQVVPMIGASAIVSGLFAAALRFIFEMGGPLTAFSGANEKSYHVPAVKLPALFRSRKLVTLVLIWLGLNAITGLASTFAGEGMSIAWQAHVGGFIAGLLLFDLFDPK